MDAFTIGWLVWLGFFLALEGVAISRRAKGDTLSENVWRFVGRSKLRRVMLLFLLVWVSLHFLTGGWV